LLLIATKKCGNWSTLGWAELLPLTARQGYTFKNLINIVPDLSILIYDTKVAEYLIMDIDMDTVMLWKADGHFDNNQVRGKKQPIIKHIF
jgi:hypothetical protein